MLFFANLYEYRSLVRNGCKRRSYTFVAHHHWVSSESDAAWCGRCGWRRATTTAARTCRWWQCGPQTGGRRIDRLITATSAMTATRCWRWPKKNTLKNGNAWESNQSSVIRSKSSRIYCCCANIILLFNRSIAVVFMYNEHREQLESN